MEATELFNEASVALTQRSEKDELFFRGLLAFDREEDRTVRGDQVEIVRLARRRLPRVLNFIYTPAWRSFDHVLDCGLERKPALFQGCDDVAGGHDLSAHSID